MRFSLLVSKYSQTIEQITCMLYVEHSSLPHKRIIRGLRLCIENL